ncbi:MAG: hypothetical protein AB8G99_09230 [Planctomycetaceae bacterium]
MRLVVVALLVGCCAEPVVAQEVELPDWADAQKRAPVKWPKAFMGLVQNEDKQPIADAKVVVSLDMQLFPPGGGFVEKPVFQREVTTSEDGTWSLLTKDFPVLSHRPLVVVVKASAPDLVPWRSWNWHGYSTTTVKARQPTITLPRGYAVSGVCVDEQGNPAKGVRFRLHHSDSRNGAWATRQYACNDRGEFSLLLPKAGTKSFWIYGESHSPMFKLAPNQTTENLRYNLKDGSVAMGFVRGPDGKPAADVVVQAVSKETGRVRAYSIPFEPAVRTDKQGRFRLPPLRGEYQFRLTSGARLLDGSYFTSPTPAPVMLPVARNMDTGREKLILRTSKSAVVSGTVRWQDGTPAADTMMAAYKMPKGNGSGLSVGRMITDKNGRYSFRVPVPLEMFLVSADHRSRNGKHYKPAAKTDAKGFDCDESAMTKLLESATTIDFDLVEY